MANLNRALSQINAIRGLVAQGTEFRGYGAESIAVTGLLAAAAAGLQAAVAKDAATHPVQFLKIWISTAVLAVALTGLQTIVRTRRVHHGLVGRMMLATTEAFVPPIAAGALVTLVLWQVAPQALWTLPGLWQIFYGLGLFACCRFVPRQMLAVGVWFLATGSLCLATGMGKQALSPWEMGFPFGIGQLLIAAIVKFGYHRMDEDA